MSQSTDGRRCDSTREVFRGKRRGQTHRRAAVGLEIAIDAIEEWGVSSGAVIWPCRRRWRRKISLQCLRCSSWMSSLWRRLLWTLTSTLAMLRQELLHHCLRCETLVQRSSMRRMHCACWRLVDLHDLLRILPNLRSMGAQREPESNKVGLSSVILTQPLTRSKMTAQQYIRVLTFSW